jgi:hypothetical protein
MEQTIIQGLKNAFETNKEFQGFEYADLKPEYLLKYHIGSKIKENYPDFKIRFETPTMIFFNDSIEKNKLLTSSRFEDKRNKEEIRKGFIDIAVYDANFQANSLVEVKLVNPQNSYVLKDLKRIVDFISAENICTIKFGYFVYVFKNKIFSSPDQIQSDIDQSYAKARQYIDKLDKEVVKGLNISLTGCSIGYYSHFENDKEMEEKDSLFDLGELIIENVHYIGIVIKIAC